MGADLRAGVTVVIATIPPRAVLLTRAVASVAAQTLPVSLVIEEDSGRAGSAVTRNRALAKVESEFVLCCDDDDQLMPNAAQVLAEAQQATGADVVSGGAWLTVPPHREPVDVPDPGWIPAETVTSRSVLHVTSLIRTELLREAGGFEFRRCPATNMLLDDYGAYCRLAEHGARFWRVPETVLIWHLHGANTSGRGDRWLALVEPIPGPRDHLAECGVDRPLRVVIRERAPVLIGKPEGDTGGSAGGGVRVQPGVDPAPPGLRRVGRAEAAVAHLVVPDDVADPRRSARRAVHPARADACGRRAELVEDRRLDAHPALRSHSSRRMSVSA
jgi:hypothetical protein